MSDLAVAVLMGIVQGLTEFLPISSTAHLALIERALRLDPARFGLSFTVALHLGTLVAVLIYFADVWLGLLRDVLARRSELLVLLIVATVPAAIVGVVFDELIAGPLRDPRLIAAALVAGSLVFVLAERAGAHAVRTRAHVGDAAAMGLAQALAFVPGLSRSGMTISAGLARGLRRDEAARLSFVLSSPAIFGAAVKTFLDASASEAVLAHPDTLVVGFACSLVAGFAAIWGLIRFLRRRSLSWFVPYRVALAAVIALAVAGGAL